jgi:hypothetical protein
MLEQFLKILKEVDSDMENELEESFKECTNLKIWFELYLKKIFKDVSYQMTFHNIVKL